MENAIPVKDRIKQFESNPHTSEILRSSKTVKQTQPKAELMDTSPTQVNCETVKAFSYLQFIYMYMGLYFSCVFLLKISGSVFNVHL